MAADTKPPARFIGCDVGKASIVLFDSASGNTTTLPNSLEALRPFAAGLDATCLVVCEATGGYEATLLTALAEAGRAVHRADARKVKAFIRSFGTLGKTDAIDARALARYGAERHTQLPRWRLPDAKREELQMLVLTRSDLVVQRLAFANRLAAPTAAPVRGFIEPIVHLMERQIDAIEARIAALIAAEPALAKAAATLQTIGGVGPTTAAALLGLMPELGTLSGRQAAALAGLAPHPRQSGASDGYRNTRGGRPQVKRALFMAALCAARYDGKLKTFYQRLVANGKKRIVAITAVMRKIVVIANARLRPNPYQEAKHDAASN